MSIDDRLADILGDWRARRDRGEGIDAEAIIEANPDIAERLRSEFAAMYLLNAVAAGAAVQSIKQRPDARHEGEQVGPYRILLTLGRGGSSTVYLASQEQPLRRKVAIKFLDQTLTRPESRARFEIERESLAMMDHPNIAGVLDASLTESGHPYVVMEYVDGVDIVTHCHREDMGLKKRLHLFAQVCDAIHHAHLKGVIHRDVKPANVLVTEVDDQPVPRVIDFGLAKTLAGRGAERSFSTAHGQVLGTPAYMSPEQAGGKSLDARTDVYSLGMLLYELLTDDLPWGRKESRSESIAVILRRIIEDEPPKPSTLMTTTQSTAFSEPRARRIPWGTKLKGDLDWIVLKTLDKDPERRYASAQALAADIRRHLRHEPVEACPPSSGYRIRKFTRRHRTAVASAVLLLLGLTTALVVSWRFYRQAETDRKLAVHAESDGRRHLAEARGEAAKAIAVRDFLVDVFSAAKETQQGRGAKLEHVLRVAELRLRLRGAEAPDTQAALYSAIGVAWLEAGHAEEAIPHLKSAADLMTETLGATAPETLLAQALHARALADVDRVEEATAEAIFVATALEGIPSDDGRWTPVVDACAQAFASAGQPKESAVLWRRSLARRTSAAPADRATAMMGLARALMATEATAEVDEIVIQLRDLAQASLVPDDPRSSDVLSVCAEWDAQKEKWQEAYDLFVHVHQMRSNLLGRDHPKTARTRRHLANALQKLGRDDGDLLAPVGQPVSPGGASGSEPGGAGGTTSKALHARAQHLLVQGDPMGAISRWGQLIANIAAEDSMTSEERSSARLHWLGVISRTFMDRGMAGTAVVAAAERWVAAAREETARDPADVEARWTLARALGTLGGACMGNRQHAEAAMAMQECVRKYDGLRSAPGKELGAVARAACGQKVNAWCLSELGRHAEARMAAQNTLRRIEGVKRLAESPGQQALRSQGALDVTAALLLTEANSHEAELLAVLARAEMGLGTQSGALEKYDRAIKAYRTLEDKGLLTLGRASQLARLRNERARCLMGLFRFAGAVEAAKDILKFLDAHRKQPDPGVYWWAANHAAHLTLAEALMYLGQTEEAMAAVRETLPPAVLNRIYRTHDWSYVGSGALELLIVRARLEEIAGNPEIAAKTFRQALGLVQAHRKLHPELPGIGLQEVNLRMRMVQVATGRGDFTKSLMHLEAIRSLCARLRGAQATGSLGAAWHQEGHVRLQQGRLSEAKVAFERQLALHAPAHALDPSDGNARSRMMLGHSYLADVLRAMGDIPEARKHYEKELALAQQFAKEREADSPLIIMLVHVHSNLGQCIATMGEIELAKRHFLAAKSMAEDNERVLPRHVEELRGLRTAVGKQLAWVALRLGERPPENPLEHLELAYFQLMQKKDPVRALASFECAIVEPSIRADWKAGHLYGAACAASLAAANSTDGDRATGWRAQALAWLREDFEQRLAALKVARAQRNEQTRKRAEALWMHHLQHARVNDPDLAILRAMTEFNVIIKEMSAAEEADIKPGRPAPSGK